MKSKYAFTIAVLVSAVALGGWAFRQEGGMEGGGPPMPKPTPHHAHLKSMEGTWECTVKMAGHDGQPSESKGTETIRMLGEFWAVSEFKGDMMGMPFMGTSLDGFDTDQGKHVGMWVDSMSPDRVTYEGECSNKCMTITCVGQGKDHETGKPCKLKMVTEMKDKDHRTFTMSQEGKPEHTMVITYTRKK